MTKLLDNIINIFYKVKKVLEHNKYIQALKLSFTVLFPIFFIGSISLLLESFPLEFIREWINTSFNGSIKSILSLIYKVTCGMVSLYLVLALTSKYYPLLAKRKDTTIFACINSLICYVILIGPKIIIDDPSKILNYTGITSIFPALITSLVATLLYNYFLVKITNTTKHKFSSSFQMGVNSIIPLIICAVIFLIVSLGISAIANGKNFNDLVFIVLSKPFEKAGSSFLSGLFVCLCSSICWLFGIHGNSVFENTYRGVFGFSNGGIVSKYFFDLFTTIGGAGGTLMLLIAIVIFSRGRKKKRIAAYSSPLITFNINETLIFGIPVIFNPIYFIPFLLVPIVNYTVCYFAIEWGIVPPITNPVEWTTPVLINGYIATGSFAGVILQIICILNGIFIYTPFVLLDNKVVDMSVDEKNSELKELTITALNNLTQPVLVNRNDYLGAHAEELILNLEDSIIKDDINLFYQPIVKDNKIISVEALLRFKYYTNSHLYAPMVVALAKEKDLFEDLTKCIIRKACKDFKEMLAYNKELKISVNLELELLINQEFTGWLVKTLIEEGIPYHQFGIEITENSKFFNQNTSAIFDILHKNGINVYMDDFSMGHTSILYLQDSLFDYVKLDGELVKNLENPRCKEIINSIIKLGKSLNFEVIAEFVETEEQKEKLRKMGCTIFQGYLYYKPLEKDDILVKIKEKK